MPVGCWVAVLLLLLVAVTRAQSGDGHGDGDGDGDMEPRVSCTSHILRAQRNLTCGLVGGRSDLEDDEDQEADGVQNMTVCFMNYRRNNRTCLEVSGDTVSSRDLDAILPLNVTVRLRRGGVCTTTVLLRKIVKPERPQVKNVTFNPDFNQMEIQVQTPYHNEYLTLDNQLFQLLVRSAGSTMTQNISSDTLRIDMEHLQGRTEYRVKVRAIPVNGLQGTWSEWSDTFTFFTPAEEKVQKPTEERRATHKLVLCLVILVVVPSSVVFFWKHKILTLMWPSIPHPKHALLQVCKPHRGLLLNLKPEVFSALKVEQTEEQPCEETEPSAADGAQSSPPCSTQSSDCCRSTTSVSTEELELSALLSSSDGEDGLQSTSSPSPVQGAPTPERSGGGNEAEDYVTMSSFYQIN